VPTDETTSRGLLEGVGLTLRALWPPLVAWIAISMVFMALGYPPLLCVTPLSWVLALYAGWAARRGAAASQGWWEAGTAGGLLGLAQGLLFGAYNAALAAGSPAAVTGALLRGAGIGLGGLAGGTLLALLAAAWSRRAA
jgi:hypothetical protein